METQKSNIKIQNDYLRNLGPGLHSTDKQNIEYC